MMESSHEIVANPATWPGTTCSVEIKPISNKPHDKEGASEMMNDSEEQHDAVEQEKAAAQKCAGCQRQRDGQQSV